MLLQLRNNLATLTIVALTCTAASFASTLTNDNTGVLTSPNDRSWVTQHFEVGESISRLKFQANAIPSGYLQIGAHISLFPPLKVPLNNKRDYDYDGLDEWMSFGLDLKLRVWRYCSLEICPIKGALIVGNDWAAIFPAWHVAPQLNLHRVIIGSQFNLFRESSGDFYSYWVPVVVNYRF